MESDLTKRMRADLLMGEFRHGQWLRLGEMERRYKVSRFEVRKTLASLAAVGILEHVENCGYRLAAADPEKDAHHREVRYILERAAAVKIYHRATLADLESLHQLAQIFQKEVTKASLVGAQAANDAFHRAFFALCGNPVLAQMINEMRELVRPYSTHPYATQTHREKSAVEHFEMLDCIEGKNLEGLHDAMRRHLYRVSNEARYRQENF